MTNPEGVIVPTAAQNLAPMVRTLAELRRRQAEVDRLTELQEKAFYESAAMAAMTAEGHELKAQIEQTELRLKANAVAEYKAGVVAAKAAGAPIESVSKAVSPGVNIRVGSVWKYVPADVFPVCKEKGLCILPEQLDTKAFEKLLKSGAMKFPGCTEEEVVTATLSSDLDAALAAS